MRGRDLPELMRMSRENMSEIIWRSWGLPWRDDSLLEMLTDPQTLTEVIEEGGQIVAYFCVEWHPRSLFINSIQVREGWSGKGLGTTMIDRIERMAILSDLTALELWVQTKNQKAIGFYHYMGFHLVNRKGNNYLMRKRLGRCG